MAGNRQKGGLGNNRILFLLVLAGIGLFLHYNEKPQPWQSLKNDILGVFGVETSEKKEEKTNDKSSPGRGKDDTVATDEPGEAKDENLDSEETSNAQTTDLDAYLPAYDADAQVIRHRGYTLRYEEDYEQASWVVHRLPGTPGRAKRSDRFMPDPLVKTKTALPSDYARTGYDRGHLAPAGDFKYDQQLTYESFYMSNMSPQAHDFNTGIWSDIEQKVRTWAKRYGPCIIVTGPVLKPGLPTIGRSTEVAVPEQYYKIIYDPNRQKAIAFLIENKGFVEVLIRDFTVSIDEVERATGIDFFAQLPDTIERSIESQHEDDAWF
ncbi:MAG: DNA/RNA non-specific endonuclease [Cytophagaceae bacterium]|nr:DNA/RNA non-specific endonuclease [Cytophagaceae bacterium]